MAGRRDFLKFLGASPIAAKMLVSNAAMVQGPENFLVPSRQLDIPLPEPLVLATTVNPVRMQSLEGYFSNLTVTSTRDVQKVWAAGESAIHYIMGYMDTTLELKLVDVPDFNWSSLKSMHGRLVKIYFEVGDLGGS